MSGERFDFIKVEVLQNGFLVHRVCGWREVEQKRNPYDLFAVFSAQRPGHVIEPVVETLFEATPSELGAIVGASAEGLPALRRRLSRHTKRLTDRGAPAPERTRETEEDDE